MKNSVLNSALPKVSIIIATLNAVETFQRCLNSIYRQSYTNLEIIVSDGGSIDGTVERIKDNTMKLSYWASEPDNGIYDAMNRALDHITGDWVYFLGADDILTDNFSELLYHLKDNQTIYYGKVMCNGNKTYGLLSAYRFAKHNICQQAIVYPAAVFSKYKYSLNYPISADHLLNMQCWKDKEVKFQFVDLVIAVFNTNGISSTQVDTAFQADKAWYILKYYGLLIYLRFVFRRLKHTLQAGKLQS